MKFIKVLALIAIFITTLSAKDIFIFQVDNSGKMTPKDIESAFAKAGFKIEDNRDMNLPYTKQFGKTHFDTYNLFTLYDKELVHKLLPKYPNIGVFAPMSMGIWKFKGKKELFMSFLSAKTMAKAIGADESDKLLKELEDKVLKVVKSLKGKEIEPSYKPVKAEGELLTKFSLESDSDSWYDTREESQMMLENNLKPKGFVMANFSTLVDADENDGYEFDFYDSYSICKLVVIYQVSQTRPEAGAFAPCSLSMYKKKDSDEIVMAYPSVYNWISTLAITDKKAIDELIKAQKDMEANLKSLTE